MLYCLPACKFRDPAISAVAAGPSCGVRRRRVAAAGSRRHGAARQSAAAPSRIDNGCSLCSAASQNIPGNTCARAATGPSLHHRAGSAQRPACYSKRGLGLRGAGASSCHSFRHRSQSTWTARHIDRGPGSNRRLRGQNCHAAATAASRSRRVRRRRIAIRGAGVDNSARSVNRGAHHHNALAAFSASPSCASALYSCGSSYTHTLKATSEARCHCPLHIR